MAGESNCRTCGRDLALMCRICDVDSEHVDNVTARDEAEAAIAETLELVKGPPGAILSPEQALQVYQFALAHLQKRYESLTKGAPGK